jgi:hypothetical protein
MAIIPKSSKLTSHVLRRIGSLAVFFCPFVLWMLPATYFDSGQTLCLSQYFFETQCLGCGITRAVQHAMHFDFQAAWAYNKLVVLVFPLLVFIWASETFKLYRFLATCRLKA